MKHTELNAYPLRTLAKRNGIGVSTCYNLARAGRLRITKIGAKALVTAAEEKRFIESLPSYQHDPTGRFCRGGGRKATPAKTS